MITNEPILSILDSASPAKSYYDKAAEALYMVKGILGVVRGATDSDFNSAEIYSGDVSNAVAAAIFITGIAQEHIDSLHGQLLSTGNEGPHEGIS